MAHLSIHVTQPFITKNKTTKAEPFTMDPETMIIEQPNLNAQQQLDQLLQELHTSEGRSLLAQNAYNEAQLTESSQHKRSNPPALNEQKQD